MNKWELARYLVDAKKNIDSLLFIDEHIDKISNLDIRENLSYIRRNFYINCCVVLDKTFPKDKREICEDDIISSIYYERDKNFAHKDDNYNPQKYSTILEMINDMKVQLCRVRVLCKDSLPDSVTLDYVPHDRVLFRFLYGMTAEKEEALKKIKYPLYGAPIVNDDVVVKKIFKDTEDKRLIEKSDTENYAVVVEDGINWYESLQNNQDFCIRLNVLYNQNTWCTLDKDIFEKMMKLKALGLFDDFCVPIMPDFENAELMKKIQEIVGVRF